MNWNETAWQAAEPIRTAIRRMPFLQALADGTLAPAQFAFYIAQDAHYLEYFGRALSLIAARVPAKTQQLAFIRFAEGAIVVEQDLHARYFGQLGITAPPDLSPACHHYVHFLQATAALAPVEVAVAAVLPCFRVYKEVGEYLLSLPQQPGNPYQAWIDTYGGEAFGLVVDQATEIAGEMAAACTPEQQQAMTTAFVTACRLEWMFWDSAWRLESWEP